MIRDFVEEKEDRPADATTLSEALEQAGDEGLTYLYDFGDDCEHAIEASQPKPSDTALIYPRLTKMIGTCPPEDGGGAPGYQMFLQTMADPKDPEHKQLKAWYGGKFDRENPNEKQLKASVANLAKRWQS